MPENNTDNLEASSRPLNPEELELLEKKREEQQHAAEFANAKESEGQIRQWSTPSEKEALADKAAEITGKHNEAGMLMPDSIPKDKQTKVDGYG